MESGVGDPIRPMQHRDLDAVVALWDSIVEHHRAIDPVFGLSSDAEIEIRGLLAAQLQDPDLATFVWDEDGGLAGFCAVRIDRAPPILAETVRAEITEIGVLEGQRRRGIAGALASAATDWLSARGVERIEVRVASRNPEGQAFWRALGFSDIVDVLHRRL